MKAISIKQPWASLIIEGIKDIENRNWFTYHRDFLYIHTGKRFDHQGADLILKLYPDYKGIIDKSRELRGGIIGTVNLVSCVTYHSSPWFHGKYGFVFNTPQKIDFFPMKGKLGVFSFEFDESRIRKKREVQLSLF